MHRKSLSFLLLLLFPFGISILTAEGNNWELAKEKDGLKVYTRPSTKSSMKDSKSIMELNFKPEQVVMVIRDFSNYHKWMDRSEKVEIIKKVTETQYYLHYFTSAPWPVADRDNVALWTFTQKEDKTYFITVEAKPDFIPKVEGRVRVPYSYSTWTIGPNDKGGVRVEHYNSAEAGGDLPGWMANMGVVDYPFNTLQGLARELENRF
ncbi:MAG: hypothetical protein H6581_17245 [Bacteroidia bacterium]|nr:hypothetical protein [Bacteroidia bacterium]